MKKKLLVAAVAGALAAPAVAVAQSSTVNIYGLFNWEYGVWVDNINNAAGASRNTTDELNSGASRIGFRGEEKLGGGLSAWFQCESSLEFLGGSTTSTDGVWCDRNSALGLKGGWGNFYIGSWDSPWKQVTSATRMLNETGWLGAQRFLATLAGPSGTVAFSARNVHSLNYASPNMGGFSIAAQATTENPARNSLETNTAIEYRRLGLNGMYRNGPLVAGAGWSKHENRSGTVDGRDQEAWVVGVNYTWRMFKVGGVYSHLEDDGAIAGAEAERDNVSFAVDWKLGGPGMVRFGVTMAGETEIAVPCAVCGSAIQYQISYNHSLSKRTKAYIGYVMVDNGSGGSYNLHGLSTDVMLGDKASAVSVGLQHSF
jgi:predicted porin